MFVLIGMCATVDKVLCIEQVPADVENNRQEHENRICCGGGGREGGTRSNNITLRMMMMKQSKSTGKHTAGRG